MKLVLIPQPRSVVFRDRAGVATDAPVRESVDASVGAPQSYRLEIDEGAISLTGADAAGLFYARQTLQQIRRQLPKQLPNIVIEDSPDFPVRGVMLDISRDKVPTTATLLAIVDQLAELKVNQLQLYTEHTFAYRNHEVVWRDASPMTGDEILQLDRYCRDRFIELVPNQNSFGHLERWFKHEEYAELAEAPDGFTFPSGKRMTSGFSLDPLDPRSIKFVESLFDELLPNFSSKLFNVGCDETFDIGLGHSQAQTQRLGRERVYLDFVLKIYAAVRQRRRTMMFWGDIILNQPQLLSDVPRDVIALNWGYEANHPFDKETSAFRDSGIPFYVCPGTSSWCSISGRTDNALANLRNAAESGLKHGAIGYLITDWGDYGHLQYLPISWLGMAAGAAYSWCLQANRDIWITDSLDVHIFRDPAGVIGKLLHDFGNIYQSMNRTISNSTQLFWTLVNDESHNKLYADVTFDEYDAAQKRIEQVLAPLRQARIDHPDATLIADELLNGAAMLRHACRRGKLLRRPESVDSRELANELRAIIAEHRRLWLARNRPGGLNDSAAQLEKLLKDYEANQ
jgi:hexosaminidase